MQSKEHDELWDTLWKQPTVVVIFAKKRKANKKAPQNRRKPRKRKR